jgi:hypothetical protein
MSLNGSLSDFDISFIFQIIAQENKTGILTLSSDNDEGYIVFNNGNIISAGTNKQNIQTMIYRYLLTIKQYPSSEINEFRSLVKDNLNYLSHELIAKQYITPEELSILTEYNIEDIACSIFQWKKGNYKFDTLINVGNHQIGNLQLKADAITMEAARRMDESERMRKLIKPNTVFYRTDSRESSSNDFYNPLNNFSQYLLNCIDGTSSTEYLIQESFFSEYRIYETLFELLNNNNIAQLSDKISDSVNEALKKLPEQQEPLNSKIVLSIIITFTIIAAIYFSGYVLIKGYIFSRIIYEQHNIVSELKKIRANKKIAIASLQYHATYGKSPYRINDLVKSGIITKRDLNDFIIKKKKYEQTGQRIQE